MKKNLYVLMSGCDEGSDIDCVYQAVSELDVVKHMLREMRKGTKEGESLLNIFLRANIGYEYSQQPGFDNAKAEKQYVIDMEPDELLQAIAKTYIDGDSYHEIRIVEIKSKNIIDL